MVGRPMLAAPADLDRLRFPVLASPKIDGIRAIATGSSLLSRSLKLIPNLHTRIILSNPSFAGLDGELTAGEPTEPDCYRKADSAFMTQQGEPNFTYWVFDYWNMSKLYSDRYRSVLRDWRGRHAAIKVVTHRHIQDMSQLLEYEAQIVDKGYEGIMINDPYAPYKNGRSTVGQGYLLKLKRFIDSEAEIIDILELQHNDNAPELNELGLQRRSSHKAGKRAGGVMGALVGRDLKSNVKFKCGTGFNDIERAEIWAKREDYMRKIFKYRYCPIGIKDKPRQPSYLGMRSPIDF